MTTPYTFGRTRDGYLQAETRAELGAERRELRITTDRAYNGGVECKAVVVQINEDGSGYSHAFAMSQYGKGDFRRVLARDPKARATEKAIRVMHETNTADVVPLLAEARAYYAAQAAPEQQGCRCCSAARGGAHFQWCPAAKVPA